MINEIVARAPFFLLIAARCFALIMVLPLVSMPAVSRVVKVALAGYMAFIVLPHVNFSAYADFVSSDGKFTLEYAMILAGEVMIGIITGFYVSMIFAAFSTAGQFFAFQMGFSASSVYDALSQVENPLVGQYLNFVAMLVFIQNNWFQKLFLQGLVGSFDTVNVMTLVAEHEKFTRFLLKGLTNLFSDALIIALPIMGTLVLVNVTMGILSKAAPAMNLLSEGFPTMILLSFYLIFAILPQIVDFFGRSFNIGISDVILFYRSVHGAAGGT